MNEIKEIKLCDGEYASKWTLTDFYAEAEAALSAAIASGGNFETSFRCQKEARYCRITRNMEADELWIEVTAYMDDLYDTADLIYDVIEDDVELSDDIIDSIQSAAYCSDIDDHATLDMLLSAKASYSDVVEAIELLEVEAEEALQSMFCRLSDIVDDFIKDMKS